MRTIGSTETLVVSMLDFSRIIPNKTWFICLVDVISCCHIYKKIRAENSISRLQYFFFPNWCIKKCREARSSKPPVRIGVQTRAPFLRDGIRRRKITPQRYQQCNRQPG
uniref:Uncharacterized protein n=1 Tax=Arundo donax TaxID=35708 RepID=A0A0A9H7P3_ARUDO